MIRFLVLIAAISLPCLIDAADYLITAPNVFRTDVEEDVLISIFGEDGGSPLQIEVTLTLFNSDDIEVESKTAMVTAGQPKVVKFIVSKADLMADEEVPTFVLEVSSDDPLLSFNNRAPLLVTTKNQVVFIQTDKPIYTPDQEVKIRVISLNENLKPTDRSVRLEVVTPRGAITERRDELTTDTGYLTQKFQFSTYPTFGIWKINVYYGLNNEWKSTVEFELQEYVLPTFDVTIEGQKQILPSDTTITATVTARYVYNKDVRGNAQVKMKVMKGTTTVHTFPAVAKELNEFGKGSFNIDPVETLGEEWFSTLENGILWIEAVVTETATGDRENTTISAGKFVKQVYRFKRDRTISYFKKGNTFDIKIDLAYSDGTPGINILTKIEAVGFNHADGTQTHLTGTSELSLEKTSNNLGQVDFRVDVNQNIDEIEVVIRTLDSNYPPEANGVYIFTLYPIESPSQAYLQIRVRPGEIQVADNFEAEVVKSGSTDVFGLNYFVIVRGKIVQAWSDLSSAIGSHKTVRLDITREMAPSARLVIYSIVGDEIVADSALLDIVDVCAGELAIQPKDSTLTPGDSTVIKITGDSGGRVALLAVDEAVYFLKDFHRLTKKKMFQRMETLDLGCGPGGGMNSLDVFESAGLLAMSSTNIRRTNLREGYGCQTEAQKRRRRAVNENQVCYDEFESDDDLCSACEDGFIHILGKTCQQRINRFSKRKGITIPTDEVLGSPPDVSKLDPIVAAFYNCCVAKEEERNLIVGRTSVNEVEIDEERSVRVRSHFPETWIFDDYNIPDNGNEISVSLPVPDSITNWILQASSVSGSMGMCVADERQIEVFKNVFIALKMPYSIIKGEQIQVQATLFNYGTIDVIANIYMIGTENVCSQSPPGERGPKHQLTVTKNNAVTTYFSILPMDVGSFDIEIKAFTNLENDGIKKQILVVHEGVERYHSKVILIDPTDSRASWSDDADTKQDDVPLDNELPFTPTTQSDPTQNIQVSTIQLNIDDQNAIIGTEQCFVTFFGDVMAPSVSAIAGGLDPSELIALPIGCGEQTMMYMSASVYTMLYLTNNNILTKELKSDAVDSIENGYKKMVEFQRTDGSFSAWGEARPASTWLTAYTIKVFYHVLQLNLFVDPNALCGAFKFIESRYRDVNNVQNQGMFYEGYPALHTDMTGGISGEKLMTAFVVTALTGYKPSNQAGAGLAGCNVNYQDKIGKAVTYLEENFSSLSTNYHRAVVAYALHVVGSNVKDDAWAKVKKYALYDDALGVRHWQMDSKALSVEATSYALLIALLRNEIPYANGIVNWLTAHRDFKRGFSSTSDTAIALEALATYAMAVKNNNVSMTCVLSAAGELGLPGNYYHKEVIIDNDVATLSQQVECPVSGTVYILCTGYGVAQAQVEIIYNTPASTPGEECAFFIYAQMPLVADQCSENEPSCTINNYVIDISVKYEKELNGQTDMAIVEVGLLTGFTPVQNSIDLLVSNASCPVDHYEIVDRKVILYLDTLTSEITNLQFQVQKLFEVANYQSVSVTVYDYYFPEKRCTSFYNPYDEHAELRQLCIDETLCKCAAGACPRCLWPVKELPDYDTLYNNMACGSETDYVYEVSAKNTVTENGFIILKASVITRIKAGKDNFTEAIEDIPGIRLFVMKSTCFDCKNFEIGHKYLIMGKDGLPYLEDGVTKYKYLLDSTSYIEKWPKKSETKDRFKLVRKVKNKLLDDGCT